MNKVVVWGVLCMGLLGVHAEIDRALADAALARGVKIAVWPQGRIPVQKGTGAFAVKDTNGGIVRLTDVNVPELAFFPAGGSGVCPAVLVCPGGGYSILAYNHEGVEIAEALNAIGFSAFVLKYRCPGQRDAALMDAQRALSLIRARADEWKIDPKRLGIMGFSAGANLACRVSTCHRHRSYAAVDAADAFSCRPDFSLPIYPWMLVVGENKEKTLPLTLRGDFPVDETTPPAFIVQTEDDFAHVENALGYYAALKYAGVMAEMHLFPKGGHGYGIRPHGTDVDGWEALAAKWLTRNFKSLP
ncbi:MAG: alpha/beta hydrolase [Kiritimatiellia bacterium]